MAAWPNSSADATAAAIRAAPSGLGILSSLHNAFADTAKGNGVIIALVLSLASAAIGVCVALDVYPKRFLTLAIVLSLAYWVLGQGFGGIFTGSGTDPNAGPLFALLALAVWPPQTAHGDRGLSPPDETETAPFSQGVQPPVAG